MYGKIFQEIFDGSLASGGWLPIYIFQSMIILADADGYLKMSRKPFLDRIGLNPDSPNCPPKDEINKAFKILESQDPESNLPNENGKRIIPLSKLTNVQDNRGWWIVNYEYYRDKASKYDIRIKARERKRRQRERERKRSANCHGDVTHGHGLSRVSRHTDTDTDTDIKKQHDSVPESVFFVPGNIKKLSEIFINMEKRGKQIEDLKKKTGRFLNFNPWQYTQKALNEGLHPGLVVEVLDSIIGYWDNIETNPWQYTSRFKKIKMQNWNEREAISIHKKFKAMDPGALTELTRGMFNRI